MTSATEKVIEQFDNLPVEEKEYVKDLIDKIIIEARRDEIIRNANISRDEREAGNLSFGSAEDILKALDAD